MARLRTDLLLKALTQAPGALVAAAVAFFVYEDPTLFEFAIGFAAGTVFAGIGGGWMMWSLHRKPLADRPDLSTLPASAALEPVTETRRHHLVRVPLYLALDALVIAVFAIVGAGFLVASTATSLVLAWRLSAWEQQSNVTLYCERRRGWELRRKKPYWYYERTPGRTATLV